MLLRKAASHLLNFRFINTILYALQVRLCYKISLQGKITIQPGDFFGAAGNSEALQIATSLAFLAVSSSSLNHTVHNVHNVHTVHKCGAAPESARTRWIK